ncbi:hypothetical protein [Antribacter gilvus]|uniref:hypothetical protein n=1 Tax=Antribacter gilvus TaxID=2304675 RepID=UPI000F7B4DB0|nr:hypothetical protein [Antribacter gilvus]
MMRRTGSGLLLGVSAAVALLALTACAQQVDTPGGGGSASPSPEASTGGGDEASPSPTATSSGAEAPVDAAAMPLEPGATGRGLPDGVPGSMDSPAGAAWSPEEGLLYVVTYGSSSCPSLAEPEATADGGTVTVSLLPPKDGMCTMDWAPTTTVVAVPAGTDEAAPVSMVLGTHGTVEVPPRATAGETGEAAWVGLS